MTNWLESITGPLGSLSKSAEKLMEVRDLAKLGDVITELQAKIMAAQQGALAAQAAQTAMAEEVRDLKARVAQLEAWNAEKQRYELAEIGAGAFAYVVKPAMRRTEPAHCVCSECYQTGHKSILQVRSNTYGSVVLQCPHCKSEVFAPEDHPSYPLKREYAEDPYKKHRTSMPKCPLCAEGRLMVYDVEPHLTFGEVGGLQLWHMHCDSCEHEEQRNHDPSKD